jgi:multidrug resistance efflux pump
MRIRKYIVYSVLSATVFAAGCRREPAVTHAAVLPDTHDPPRSRQIRATGAIQAEKVFTVQVPQITGQGGGRLTLVGLVENGVRVKAGQVVAEFDRTQQIDNARDTQAKFDDLGHQVDQKAAEFRSNAEKRRSDLQKAEADLSKALLQLKRGPLLSEIDRLKNEAQAENARSHVESLKISSHYHDVSEAAGLKILELQRDRQKVSLDRALGNSERLIVKAPLSGMIALENVWRNNSMGKAQEGDQLVTGQALLRIFDPAQMVVDATVGEPDGAVLVPGAHAKVRLDAYPDLTFTAHFISASPVAASALGAPIKTFSARFRLEQTDPHLLPDLSAAVIVEANASR